MDHQRNKISKGQGAGGAGHRAQGAELRAQGAGHRAQGKKAVGGEQGA